MHSKPGGMSATSIALIALLAFGCRAPLNTESPPPDEIETSLFLIGDAGEPDPRDVGVPLESLTAHVAEAPGKSIVLFLGDNVYPDGIPEEGHAEFADARRRLEAQVSAIPDGARAIFIPGNHDWASELAYGLFAVRRQEQLISAMARGRDIRMLPGNGCPGPVALDIGRLRLIVLDTQWWLHGYIVRDSLSRCSATTMGQVTAELRRQVTVPDGHVVVVSGHHPLMTGGEHGGYCGVTGPFRRFAGRAQDVLGGINRRMRDSLELAFSAKPPLLYAAGHDHSLQVLHGGKNVKFLVVSGAGAQSKGSCVVTLRESLYTSPRRSGFMRLDVMRGGGALLRVYRYSAIGSGGLSFSTWLEERP
ncbi:MAG TPA: metallophosphoesterase [Gemmatimonadaceae bacterium]|nr:metallophosphoesterase [Gemmatimonadaceae bacterium]